jgi:hypothetical protein
MHHGPVASADLGEVGISLIEDHRMERNVSTRRILFAAAAAEAFAGLALLVLPSIVTALLLGAQASGLTDVMSRVAGIALIALACACWPRATHPADSRSCGGLLIYNGLAALLLAYLGVSNRPYGILLWPAVAIHSGLAILLALCLANLLRSATGAGDRSS